MKRLTRYVLKELCASFLTTLLAMTVLLVLVGIVRESIRQGLGLGPVVRMIPYVLPEALRFSVPATILLATCSVYGRMASDQEVVAVKSLGIHPQVLLTPTLVFAFILSIFAVWMNDLAVTWGRAGMYRIAMESLEQIVYGMLRTQRSYTTGRFAISVKDVVDHKLIQPHISIYPAGDEPPITISARTAQLRADPVAQTLNVLLTDGMIERGEWSLEYWDQFEHVIPLADAHRRDLSGRRASDCPLQEISAQWQEERRLMQQQQRQLAGEAAWLMLSGRLDELDEPAWRARIGELAASKDRLNRLALEPWRRWANGFSCFCFVLVGAPLAVRLRTTNFFTTFAACFLPILFLYYPLMAYGVERAKEGTLPDFTVWAGNLVLAGLGLWLLRNIYRH